MSLISNKFRRHVVSAVAAIALSGCADDDADGAFVDHDEDSDFDVFDSAKADGVSATFNRHNVVDDTFFTAAEAMSVDDIQHFLEATPYGKRCFLADVSVGSTSAAQVIADAAAEHQINPVMLLSRMQVEKGLVSKSARPSQSKIDFAFGCGCHDGKACSEAFRGFDRQVECAAETMREHFDAADSGAGIWNVGVSKKSLDGLTVTPANAATASLYAYTPWVLVGKGGNWLVWNVTGKFVGHLAQTGGLDVPDPGFIGTPCSTEDADACGFSDGGDEGFCHGWSSGGESFGACTLECEGTCPDKAGTVASDTLCVELEAGVGSCLPVAATANDDCGDIPGTMPMQADRFVGSSGKSPRTATVCMPVASGDDGGGDGGGDDSAPTGPSCAGHCGDGSAVPDGNGNACFCDNQCVSAGDCCADFTDVCGG